ncbi:MAG: SRPBCC family protein [Acidobacteriota bacterium]
MIRAERSTTASAATVHDLLIDVDAWAVWSRHVASVVAERRLVEPGWVGKTRAFFAPGATTMVVDEVRPDGGFRWSSTVGPWRLDYDNAVIPEADGCAIRFTAELQGPAAGLLERLVAPISAFGQRRRMARLAALAELVDRSEFGRRAQAELPTDPSPSDGAADRR